MGLLRKRTILLIMFLAFSMGMLINGTFANFETNITGEETVKNTFIGNLDNITVDYLDEGYFDIDSSVTPGSNIVKKVLVTNTSLITENELLIIFYEIVNSLNDKSKLTYTIDCEVYANYYDNLQVSGETCLSNDDLTGIVPSNVSAIYKFKIKENRSYLITITINTANDYTLSSGENFFSYFAIKDEYILPLGNFVKINDSQVSAAITFSQSVTLYASANTAAYKMCFSNTNDNTSCTWIPYTTNGVEWTLSSEEGKQTVYAWFKDDVGNISEEISVLITYINEYVTFGYTGSAQSYTAKIDGYYQIEAWGAQGGTISTAITGGKGAYTSGTIYLNAEEKLYIYVGGENSASITATWNGGGVAAASYGKPGGGATDIRLASGTWDDITSLRSRIMVAAGGGGAGQRGGGYGDGSGGAGGGLIGLQGQYGLNVTLNYGQYPGTGGTQVAGGYAAAYNDTAGNGTKTTGTYIGYFGYGGTYQPGGGGGYYGGGGGAHAGAGSGSSFISGYAGVNAVTSDASTVATNNTIHYSGKYFINTSMIAGNEVMPNPSGGTMTGNTGSGYAKITYLGGSSPARTNTKLNNVRYIKSCINGQSISESNQWTEIQAIKEGINLAKGKAPVGTVTENATYPYSRITDGLIDASSYSGPSVQGLQCVTVDLGDIYDLDEVGLWLYYTDDRKYYDNTLSVGATNPGSGITTSLTTILHSYPGTTGYTENSQGRRYTAWD